VDELYFVHRPALYEETAEGHPDVLEITRCNRLRRDSFTRILVQDKSNRRLRKPNHAEVGQVMEWEI